VRPYSLRIAPQSLLPLSRHGSNANITEGDGPVIALQSKRPRGSFRKAATGLALEFYVAGWRRAKLCGLQRLEIRPSAKDG
jgi:hypothetical protein